MHCRRDACSRGGHRRGWSGALLSLLLLVPQGASVASERTTTSLSSVWRLESDEDYSYSSEYRAPPPVKGLALHGYFADDSFDANDGKITLGPSKNCTETVTLDDPRGLADGFPQRTTTEFWYYRSGDQGLYLSRNWRFELSDSCKVTMRVETEIVRLSLFNGRASFVAIANGGEPVLSTEMLDDDTLYPMPTHFVVIHARRLNERNRAEAKRRSEGRFNETRLRQTCFDSSISFLFSNSCYLSETGRWRGLLTATHSEDDADGAYSEYRLVDLDPEARIDGRLFEWDRKIALSPEMASNRSR